MLRVTSTGIDTGTTAGNLLDLNSTASTAGVLMMLTSASLATGTAMRFDLVGLTTGAGILVAHTTAVIANGGSLIRASSTSIDTSTTTGTLLDLSSSASTAGNLVLITDGALLTGTALNINHTAGVIASGGSLLRITDAAISTGTTTGTMIDLAATAATTANLMLITSATLTTGVGIKMVLNGLTSGNGLQITSSSTSTTARGLVQHRNSGAGNTTPLLRFTQIVQSTHFYKIFTETATGISLWLSDGTTANGNLTAVTGDICFNAGSNKPEYATNGAGATWAALV